jgi:hypothetical protein
MSDQLHDSEEETAVDFDPGDGASRLPDSDDDQEAPPGPTRSTRMRPNALDLARAFD